MFHFDAAVEWWNNRRPIQVDGFDKARAFSAMEIRDGKYNLDLCGFPHTEEEIKPPLELIEDYQRKRSELNAKIDTVLSDIVRMIKEAQK